jgi:hypothetical protein
MRDLQYLIAERIGTKKNITVRKNKVYQLVCKEASVIIFNQVQFQGIRLIERHIRFKYEKF